MPKPWTRWLWISIGVTLLVLIVSAVIYGWTNHRGWIVYTAENSGLVNNYINALAIDSQERVWVGTMRGLSVLAPDGSWNSYTTENSGLVDDNVTSLAIDNQERVWVGTDYGGLAVLDTSANWSPLLIQSLLILRNISLAAFLLECAVGVLIWNKTRKAGRNIEDKESKPSEPQEELDDVEVF